MSVCHLCSSFLSSMSLPEFPSSKSVARLGDPTRPPGIETTMEIESFGWAWQDNILMFEAAAKAKQNPCTLCATIWEGYLAWMEDFNQGGQEKHDQKFSKLRVKVPPGAEALRLTRRMCGAPGFLVWSPDLSTYSGKRGKLRMIAGVAFSIKAEIALAPEVPWLSSLPALDIDSGSPSSLNIVATFLGKCHDEHENCEQKDYPLPTRILDIGCSSSPVRLVQPGGASGKYACLSYCWGKSVPFTLTRDSISERFRNIPLRDLPKTFVDAITLVKRLGTRYLWIDSLCIIQDDADDWARESARMSDVYSGAHLVVSVDWAEDVSQGCFHHRDSRSAYPIDILPELVSKPLSPIDEVYYDGGRFPAEPLARRSWAFQERVLAQRVIHYTTQQVYYECNNGIVAEDGSSQSCRFSPINQGPEGQDVWGSRLKLWYDLVGEYGRRKLTRTTDKLPAISGLARIIGEKHEAQYLAGVWSDDIIFGITWGARGFHADNPPSEYVAPSWSWASYSGIAASWDRLYHVKNVAKVLGWNIEPKNKADPYGEVVDASLRIRAPITPLIPGIVHQLNATTDHRPRGPVEYEYDFVQYTQMENAEQKLMIMREEVTAKSSRYRCLIVTGDGQRGQMKRIGRAKIPKAVGMRMVQDEESWVTIVLV